MKVRVSYTVEVDEGFRKAITHYYGHKSQEPASRRDVSWWFQMHGASMDDVLRDEHGVWCWGDKETE